MHNDNNNNISNNIINLIQQTIYKLTFHYNIIFNSQKLLIIKILLYIKHKNKANIYGAV